MRVVSFRNRELERFWRHSEMRGVVRRYEEKLRAMLTVIAEAENVAELDTVPGWRLHPLKGDRKGVWSLKLPHNQRLTFRVEGSVVSEVDVEDYH
jgi:proteic killer suppression protein